MYLILNFDIFFQVVIDYIMIFLLLLGVRCSFQLYDIFRKYIVYYVLNYDILEIKYIKRIFNL